MNCQRHSSGDLIHSKGYVTADYEEISPCLQGYQTERLWKVRIPISTAPADEPAIIERNALVYCIELAW